MQSDLRAVLEQLTDENNDQPIELINDRGDKKIFSLVMLIPITADSEEFEGETVGHHFALLQPLDENGEELDIDRLVFDFVRDESGEVTVKMIDDPYVLRHLQIIYRERGSQFTNEDESEEECESIFGGTISTAPSDDETEAAQNIAEHEQALLDYVDQSNAKKGKKKGFFGKLFGKK